MGEDAKIAIRNARRDQNEVVKKAEKGKDISEDDSKKFQEEIQKVTDNYTKDVDEIVTRKKKS
jgi:ribosome recycling factor